MVLLLVQSAPGRIRQKDSFGFGASLGYIMSPGPARVPHNYVKAQKKLSLQINDHPSGKYFLHSYNLPPPWLA